MRGSETPTRHRILGFLQVAVGYRDIVAEGGESLLKAQGHRDRPMTPPGTTDADTEVTPLIALIQRNEKGEQLFQMFDEIGRQSGSPNTYC